MPSIHDIHFLCPISMIHIVYVWCPWYIMFVCGVHDTQFLGLVSMMHNIYVWIHDPVVIINKFGIAYWYDVLIVCILYLSFERIYKLMTHSIFEECDLSKATVYTAVCVESSRHITEHVLNDCTCHLFHNILRATGRVTDRFILPVGLYPLVAWAPLQTRCLHPASALCTHLISSSHKNTDTG